MKKLYEIVNLVKEDCPDIARFFMNGMQKYCDELELSHIQGSVLLYLLQGEKHFSQTEICCFLGTDASAISRLIDKLENMGLVERQHGSDNRREHIVVLTDIGKAKATALDRGTDEIYEKILGDLTEHEYDAIKAIFEKIRRSIK